MGIIEFAGSVIAHAFTLSPEILLILIFVFAIVAFKVFSFVLKAVITGVVFALFPIIASYLGFGVPVTLSSIVTFALLGIIMYLVYGTLRFGFKITRFAMSPFKRAFKKKEKTKVIIKEKTK